MLGLILTNYFFDINGKNNQNIYASSEMYSENEILEPNDYNLLQNSNASGTYTNNLIFVNFLGEDGFEDFNLYKNSYETFNYMFNTSQTSVNAYYKLNSNNKLDLVTDVITDDGTEAKIYTINKPRTYYMPYVIIQDGRYIINENGYFDYYLVKCDVNNSTMLNSLSPYFYSNCELISNVYVVPNGSGLKADSDYSDKIMTYNEALALANSHSNYYLVESNQRYFKEYQLISSIYDLAKEDMNLTNSDRNNDGIIDVFSVALIDDEETARYGMDGGYYWSTLLWPHKISIDFIEYNFQWALNSSNLNQYINYFSKLGYSYNDASVLVNYLYEKPTTLGLSFDTISITNYEMYDLTEKAQWKYFVSNVSTVCHELGHIFGLPDLYVYNDANDAYMVYSWSQMCANPTKSSFFTSYERLKLEWLQEGTNVVDITRNGDYTLNVVKGNDGSNVVAYRVQIDSANYVYFEYRNSSYQYFDSQCGSPGLLVYSVNITASDGNMNGAPYEIYVQSATSDTNIIYASLDVGESLGNANKDSKQDAILIYNETVNEKNTGIVVTVNSRNDDSLTFSISSPDLLPDVDTYSVEDFDNNIVLYNKLLSQVSEGYLYRDSFVGIDTINLDNCNISSLDFLELFNLDDVVNINLANNLLSLSQAEVDELLSGYNFNIICLTGNYIDLSSISQSLLTNSKITWGVQYFNDTTVYFNQSVSLSYYYKNTDIVSIKLNNIVANLCSNGIVGSLVISNAGENVIKEEYTLKSPFDTSSHQKIFTVIKVDSDYGNEQSPLKVKVNSSFPDISNLLNVSGVSTSSLKFNYTLPLTNGTKNGFVEITVIYNSITLGVYNLYYKIVEGVTVEFINGQLVYVEKYSTLDVDNVINDIQVKENGEIVDFDYVNNGQPKTYFVMFYTGSFDEYGNANLISEVQNIDTSIVESYIVKYIIIDSFGDLYYYYKQVIITDKILLKENFDENLYNALLDIKQSQSIFIDDFANYDYIDLSNYNLSSIKGLTQLNLKQGVIINLSNNVLFDTTEISNFVNAKSEIAKVILVFNKFQNENIMLLNGQVRDKCVFAVQNLEQIILRTSDEPQIVADYYDDYLDCLTFDNEYYQISNGKLLILTYGQNINCQFMINYNNNYISSSVDNIFVQLNNASINKEYSENYEFIIEDVLFVVGCSYANLTIDTNINELNLGEVGNKLVNIFVQYQNKNLSFNYTIVVKDTTKPEITLNGDLNVYILSVEDYINNYKNDSYFATDDYDGDVKVDVQEPNMMGYGTYQVKYIAVDNSGNEAQIVRNVYIGNAYLSSNYIEVDYNEPFLLDFNFVVFNASDFDVYYNVVGDNYELFYNQNEGIKIAKFGENNLQIKLVHKINKELVINNDLTVYIDDNIAPVITLIGYENLEIYAGSVYTESGYNVSDNSTDKVLHYGENIKEINVSVTYKFLSSDGSESVVSNLDTSKTGKYTITYTATDSFGNSSSAYRIVNTVYYPIDNIRIDMSILLDRYSEGKSVRFNLLTDSMYIVNPNPLVIWYVNGVEYKRDYGMSTTIEFDEPGEYEISAQIDGTENVHSTNVKVEIYKQSGFENLFLFIGLGVGVVVIVAFVIYFVNIYRKRNFY